MPAFPTTNKIAAPPIGRANNTGDAADAGVSGRLVECFVVGREVVDIEQREPDLVGIALRQHPVALQELFEVGA